MVSIPDTADNIHQVARMDDGSLPALIHVQLVVHQIQAQDLNVLRACLKEIDEIRARAAFGLFQDNHIGSQTSDLCPGGLVVHALAYQLDVLMAQQAVDRLKEEGVGPHKIHTPNGHHLPVDQARQSARSLATD
jgi:hypothetical protein